MKQLQFIFENMDIFDAEMNKIRQWYKSNLCSNLLIHLFTESMERSVIEEACARMEAKIPDAFIVGCSTNGNIINGNFAGGSFAVVCTLFEFPSTKIEVLQYPLTADTQLEVAGRLCEEVSRRPWVKGVEMLVTIRGMSVTALCDGLSELRQGVHLFGGGAFFEDLEQDDACVFSNRGGYYEKGVVFILYGGDDYYIESSFITGWKPLGLDLNVTAAKGAFLQELNGRPAFETYYRYLHINNDDNFFFNTLEFPFFYHDNGIDILRAPTASNPDGSLTMTADIRKGVTARIAYGDPWTILDAVWKKGNELLEFSPDCLFVFSCAARRTFWGNAEVGKETEPYQYVAPTSGFYTSGEFLRSNGMVNQHNVTQVIAAMREGEAIHYPQKEVKLLDKHSFEGKVSMINRMATFIKATTQELIEANEKLEEANQRLSELSVTDVLTGIGNKNAYFIKIKELEEKMKAGSAEFCVAIFDINGLKTINDTYGHEYGDHAIIDSAKVLREIFSKENLYRIGGDEFIALLEHVSAEEMERYFAGLELLLEEENRTEKDYKTTLSLSKGFAIYTPGMDSEYIEVFRRSDEAMYMDKAEYYRTHDRRKRRKG